MKNSNKFAILAIAIAGTFALSSCSKKDDNDLTYGSNGSIKGTIKGISQDGQTLDESFSFSDVLPTAKYSNTVEDDTITSTLSGTSIRTAVKDIHFSLMSENVGSMSFDLIVQGTSVLTSQFNSSVYSHQASFNLNFTKDLGSGKVLSYTASNYYIKRDPLTENFNPNNVTFTDFKYDETSGNVSGNYSIIVTEVGANSLSHDATIAGSFSTKVYKKVN